MTPRLLDCLAQHMSTTFFHTVCTLTGLITEFYYYYYYCFHRKQSGAAMLPGSQHEGVMFNSSILQINIDKFNLIETQISICLFVRILHWSFCYFA